MRTQYCFVFLESSVSFMNAIKGIMLKKEIMASAGEICFYYRNCSVNPVLVV